MVENHRKYLKFGDDLVIDPELPTLEFTKHYFPLLHNGELKDQDVLVHSLGCSVWNTFGHTKGYMAVVECPAPGTHGADIRSDSGWFNSQMDKPDCLIEFERFEGNDRTQAKLEEKLKNLIEAGQRWEGSPHTLILSAWSQGIVKSPDTERLRSICRLGFTSGTGTLVSLKHNTNVIFSKFSFGTQNQHLTLERMHYETLL